jgi:hypothetical protein
MVAGFPSEQVFKPFWWLSTVSNHSIISTVSMPRGHKKGHNQAWSDVAQRNLHGLCKVFLSDPQGVASLTDFDFSVLPCGNYREHDRLQERRFF